jgi:hypothetical protein
VQSKFIEEASITSLKEQLANELVEIKKEVYTIYHEAKPINRLNLGKFQKAFLTFKPLSWVGWILVVLFYIVLLFFSFGILGLFVGDDGKFSATSFRTSMHDTSLVIGLLIEISFILIIRWRALVNFKSHLQKIPAH